LVHYVYPLLFLLLKRHYDIMRLASKHILIEYEWDVMNISLATVFQAIDERTKNLEAIFKATSMDVRERLGNFAFGMFQFSYGEYTRDPINNTICTFQEEDGYPDDDDEGLGPGAEDGEKEKKAIDAGSEVDEKAKKTIPYPKETDILLYETQNEPTDVYNFETIYPPPHPPMSIDALDGVWTGQLQHVVDGKVTATAGTMSMVLKRTGDDLSGGAEDCFAILAVTGTVDDAHKVVLKIEQPSGYWMECMGQYDSEKETISGVWASMRSATNSSPATYPFIFTRTLTSVFRYTRKYPVNQARARWGFAIEAVIAEVQRRLSKKRSAERRRFIELEKRNNADLQFLTTPWDPLNATELEELFRLRADLRPCDSRFYYSVAQFELQLLTYHGCYCDSCKRSIRGPRLFCIQCMDNRYWDCIDLCIHCVNETPERESFVHTGSHSLVKTLRCIHDGELGWWVVEKARAVAAQIKKSFDSSRTEGVSDPEDRSAINTEPSQSEKKCYYCDKFISCPFWVCISCVNTYICGDCDANHHDALPREDGVPPAHTHHHPLLLIRDDKPIPEPLNMDSRLSVLETKILGLESRMMAIEEKLDSRFGTLESRFGSVETLLRDMAEKLSSKS